MSTTPGSLSAGWRVRRHQLRPDLDLLRLAEAAALEQPGETALFWEEPAAQRSILAVGAVHHFHAAGADRLAHIAAEARVLTACVADGLGPGPLVVGGFSFAERTGGGLPPAWFFLPRRLWLKQRDACHRIEINAPRKAFPASRQVSMLPAVPDDLPSTWHARVDRVLALIRRGVVEKIVLSRRRRCAALAVPLRALLAELRATRPHCVTFAVRAGCATFFGSSPELMLRVDDGRVHAPALAGTAPRARTVVADQHEGASLLACGKNRREHAAVIDGIVASLKQLGIAPVIGDTGVLRLPEAMHLRTDIVGHLPSALDALHVAAALHPTPAVCGTPRATAAAFLREHEPDRGWYTGGVGWMDSGGAGEVVVGLRSGLASPSGLLLHAGAGIVAGSDAQAELDETELKLEAMLVPLRALAARRADAPPRFDHTLRLA